MHGTRTHNILKCTREGCREVDDPVAVEALLRVLVNSTEVLSLYCTPLMVRELVVGFLLTEGIADGICTERMTISYAGDEVTVEVHAEGEVRTERGTRTSGCIGGVTFNRKAEGAARTDAFTISPATLRQLFAHFQRRSEMYDATGCIHSAAITDGIDVLAFAEDIGRHNAVDKTIGAMVLEGLAFGGTMMMASGRLSSEIVSKCAAWGIPVVASRTAPTARAIQIAEEQGVTVIGFVRGERFNVYTHRHRVVQEPAPS
jgi:FdhD protein